MDDTGRGLLVWNQGSDYSDAPNGQIHAVTFDGVWSAPMKVSEYGEPPVLAASDPAGHLIVAWTERRFLANVFVATSLLGGPWDPELLDTEVGPFDPTLRTATASTPILSMSRSGTALLAWQHETISNTPTTSTYATSWRFQSGFAKQSQVSNAPGSAVSLVSDPLGNGMLLWQIGGAMPSVQAARYRAQLGWQTPAINVSSASASNPILAAGETGEVVAVWYGAAPYFVGASVFR